MSEREGDRAKGDQKNKCFAYVCLCFFSEFGSYGHCAYHQGFGDNLNRKQTYVTTCIFFLKYRSTKEGSSRSDSRCRNCVELTC